MTTEVEDEFPAEERRRPIEPAEEPGKSEPRPTTPEGSFVKKKAPKLGIILGGGGVLTYAQIGVLREFTEQKVNIHAVTGLEWGALVAASYSVNGLAHESEWQLLKLPYKKFNNSGMFSSSNATSANEFDGYLKGIFKGKRINQAKVKFSCPYIDTGKGRIRVASNGRFNDVLKMCWPYPPLFDYRPRMGAPLAIREAVGHLRRQGAELIVYVDVVDKNLMFTSKQRKRYPGATLMWLQAKSVVGGIKDWGVDEVISIPLGASNYLAYESMRLFVRMGQMKSRPLIRNFANKYGY